MGKVWSIWGAIRWQGFPDSSVGKQSACNAGDPSSIPGLGRSTGEGIVYPCQYSWASLVAQLVKSLSAMWDTWFKSLGWDHLLEKGKATHSSILAWRIPWTVQSTESQGVGYDWATFTFRWQCGWRAGPEGGKHREIKLKGSQEARVSWSQSRTSREGYIESVLDGFYVTKGGFIFFAGRVNLDLGLNIST